MHELDDLLELQERDTDLDRLRHRLETLEEREIAAIAADSCQASRDSLELAAERLAVMRREQKSLKTRLRC